MSHRLVLALLLVLSLLAAAPWGSTVRAGDELPEGPHYETNAWEMTVSAAIVGDEFGTPLNWGPNEDGRQFVLVTLRVKNVSRTDQVIKSSQFGIIDGSSVVVADDDLSKRPDPLDIRPMGERAGTTLFAGQSEDFILGWRVSPNLDEFTLDFNVSRTGNDDRLDLTPWIDLDIDPSDLRPTTPLPTVAATKVPTATPVRATRTPIPRTATRSATRTATARSGSGSTSGVMGPVAGCEAFADYDEAQDYYGDNPSEQPVIDPDSDGLACEVFFGRDTTTGTTSGGTGVDAPAAPAAPAGGGCDPSYPTVCIPPISVAGDLDCGDIAAGYFPVLPPDPHGLDGNDNDGYGCESN